MQKAEPAILSTRPLPESLLEIAKAQGINIDCIPFIETEAFTGVAFADNIRTLEQSARTVVFTSMNAVDAVAAQITKRPPWEIYSIGFATREHINKKLGLQIKGEAPDAAQLAQVILANGEKNLLFFCGNIRRDALPLTLKAHGVQVEELMVYRTKLLKQKMERDYDAILFYSPSAVESFFANNTATESTVLFAIGSTTADAIRQRSTNQIIIADAPGKEALVHRMLEHFGPLQRHEQ
jgi:uroporphyrinogen-III synthase